ncbi:MAG: glutamate--tRNA ligase [Bacteroidales bacterium]|jgi:glutamyl-tRNA synthetase|nr:glutamate--tRNA ligase [Bacteroidales bacterium]
MMVKEVRVRFAPSPTGALHIGGVRTALYNYLFAKQHGGKLILRIEDTDSTRFVKGAEQYIVDSFAWLGIPFDEGVHIPNNQGISYRQSERKPLYKQYADFLLENNKAYIAFDTPQEIEEKRKQIPNFQYDASTRGGMKNSLSLSQAETQGLLNKGCQYVVRIKIEPNEEVEVFDQIYGKVVVNSSVLDDKVLWKSVDGLPTYHLANIVDDHLMQISHVIRGAEWLPSAPLHVLLYRYLGWENSMPQFAHLPLILKPDGNGKLSKRDGDRLGFPVFPLQWTDPVTGSVSNGYKEQGYLPEAVINFLALLGWNAGTEQEIFSMEELIADFSLERVSKSGAKFDIEKAKWFNHKYLQQKTTEQIAALFAPILQEKQIEPPKDYLYKIIDLVKERITFINDLWEESAFFFVAPDSYDQSVVKKRWKEDTATHLTAIDNILKRISPFERDALHDAVAEYITQNSLNMGQIMNCLRLCMVGKAKGPDLFEIIALLGQPQASKRIIHAIKTIST